MRRLLLPALLLLTAVSCASYSDRTTPRPEALPTIQLRQFQGQTVLLDIWNGQTRNSRYVDFLHDDLERSLTKAGLHVDGAAAPLHLHVNLEYLDAGYRTGRWESCARMTGELTRDGNVIAKPESRFCTTETVNPWLVPDTLRADVNADEVRTRTYYGVLGEFLAQLERTTASL